MNRLLHFCIWLVVGPVIALFLTVGATVGTLLVSLRTWFECLADIVRGE